MERLDRAVVDHLEWRLLAPQRLAKVMNQLLERREEWNERRRGHITELRKRSAEAEAKLQRIYEAIKNGVVNVADTSLKDRIGELTAIRDQAQLTLNGRLPLSNDSARRSHWRVCADLPSRRDANSETKTERTDGTIYGHSPSVSRSSIRPKSAS